MKRAGGQGEEQRVVVVFDSAEAEREAGHHVWGHPGVRGPISMAHLFPRPLSLLPINQTISGVIIAISNISILIPWAPPPPGGPRWQHRHPSRHSDLTCNQNASLPSIPT